MVCLPFPMTVLARVPNSNATAPAAQAERLVAVGLNGHSKRDDFGKRRIVMLVANEFVHDTRVYKQARSLVQCGCEVHVIAMARLDLAASQQLDGITIHRLESRISRVWRLMLAVLLWWCVPALRRIVPPAGHALHSAKKQSSPRAPDSAPRQQSAPDISGADTPQRSAIS